MTCQCLVVLSRCSCQRAENEIQDQPLLLLNHNVLISTGMDSYSTLFTSGLKREFPISRPVTPPGTNDLSMPKSKFAGALPSIITTMPTPPTASFSTHSSSRYTSIPSSPRTPRVLRRRRSSLKVETNPLQALKSPLRNARTAMLSPVPSAPSAKRGGIFGKFAGGSS